MMACVRLPYFAASIEVLADSNMAKTPFIIGEPATRSVDIYAVSPLAASLGIFSDLSIQQAQALCSELHVVPVNLSRYRRVADGLLQKLSNFSEQVEFEVGVELRADARKRKALPYFLTRRQRDNPAVYFVDLGPIQPDEVQVLAHNIEQAVFEQSGLKAAVAVASGKFPARVAAASLTPGAVLVIHEGQEAEFLAHYPITTLPVDNEFVRDLHLLGLDTLGLVAQLPASAVIERFGKLGRIVHRLASGRDTSPIFLTKPSVVERVSHPFEPPVSDWQTLENVLSILAGRLTQRLQVQGQSVREIELILTTDNRATHESQLVLHQPTNDFHHIFETLKRLLNSQKVNAGVVEMELALVDIAPSSPKQLSLFTQSGVSDEELQALLHDLVRRFGDDCFYWGVSVNQRLRLPERRFRLEKVEVG